VARYATAFLDVEKWEQSTFIVGDKVMLNQMVEIAEQVTGKTLYIGLNYRKLILL
jgi:hypothetical protein